MLVIDHLAVASATLAEGVAWVEDQLGVKMQPGGQHARFGTHNQLLGLADGLYFEVIAKDPDAAIDGACWFGLDNFTGPPRLANWICRSDDLDADLAKAPLSAGKPHALSRADLAWEITVPADGTLPYGGAFPTLIEWAEGTLHPATRLPDSGCKLTLLDVTHPSADVISPMMDLRDPRVCFHIGDLGLRATFETPNGMRVLG
jgi:hypothetical protein